MIKENELRVGNIVGRKYFNPNPKNPKQEIEPCYVLGILDKARVSLDLKGRDVLKCDYDLLEQMPLIPKWLDDFGFTLKKSTFLKDECYMLGIDFKVEMGLTSFRVYYNGRFIKHILKVHELQNLFFCLTGQELSVVANGS